MRLPLALVLLLPSFAFAQPKEAIEAVQRKVETLDYIKSLEAPNGGFYATAPDPKAETKPVASLRATSAAVRAWHYLDGEKLGKKLPNKEKHAEFVLKCYDPKTGGFAEPGGKPDVTLTSIGVMAAMELGIPKEKFAKAMDYLKENAKTFEEVRIGAAAVEAWGVKDCPFKLDEWLAIAEKYSDMIAPKPKDGGAREAGSLVAMFLRLNRELPPNDVKPIFAEGQLSDGGWSKKGEKSSDIETTYRVMRALMLLKEKPKDAKKLREFIDAHRNKDGGYATKPGDKSSVSGVYYSAVISKWLDEMEAKK
jgi:prenyltransferase beta subunit